MGLAWLAGTVNVAVAIVVGIVVLYRLEPREAAWVDVLTATFAGVLWPLWLPFWPLVRALRRPPGRHAAGRVRATDPPEPTDVEVTSC